MLASPKRGIQTQRALFLVNVEIRGEPIDIPSQVLARHAAMLGSAGSGKTVMAKALIEEAAIAGNSIAYHRSTRDLARLRSW